MNPKQLAVVFGLLTLGVALNCLGDPPEFGHTEESAQIDQLRRDVEELKQNVATLRTKLFDLEYREMPRNLRLLPDGQLAEHPSGDYLRFPIEVERANAVPPWWSRDQRPR